MSEPGPYRRATGILRASTHPALVVGFAAGVVVLLTILGLVATSVRPDVDLAVALNALHVGRVAVVTDLVYHLFAPVPAVVITIAVTGLVWAVRRDIRPAAAFAGTVAATWVPSVLVKLYVDRPRPPAALLPHPFSPLQVDPSYPSGHTVFVAAFAMAVVMLLHGTRWHALAAGLGALVTVGVGVSLMIDAVHFPTDVLASMAWSAAVAPAARVLWVDVIMVRLPFLRPAPPETAVAGAGTFPGAGVGGQADEAATVGGSGRWPGVRVEAAARPDPVRSDGDATLTHGEA